MKHHNFVWLALAATILGTIPGCSPKDDAADPSPQQGRYVEEAVELPADWESASLVGPAVYGTADGRTRRWTVHPEGRLQEEASWQAPAWGEGQTVTDWAANASGRVVAAYRQDGAVHVAAYEDGAMVELPLHEEIAPDRLRQFAMLEDGSLLLEELQGRIITLDSEGFLRQDLSSPGNVDGCGIYGGKVLLLCESLEVWDPESAKQVDALPCDDIRSVNTQFAEDAGGALYAVGTLGIYRYQQQEDVWDCLIEPNASSLSRPDLFPIDATVTAEGDVLVLTRGADGQHRLFRYYFDPDMTAEPTKRLRIVTVLNESVLKSGIADFTPLHPDIQVTLDVRGDSVATASDMLYSINTELLAGKGADLYNVDLLPTAPFLDQNILLDLSEIVAPLCEGGALYPSVAASYQRGDEIGLVPLRMVAPLLCGKTDLTGQPGLSGLAQWAREHPETPLFVDNSPKALFYEFYQFAAPFWMDMRTGEIHREALEEALTSIKQISEVYGPAQEQNLYARTELLNGRVQAAIDYPFNAYSLHELQELLSVLGDGKFVPAPGGGEPVFQPRVIVGVNAQSPLSQEAKDYVECLLLSHAQEQNALGLGLPVSPAAVHRLLTEDYQKEAPYVFTIPYGELPFTAQEPLLPETIRQLEEILSSAAIPMSDNRDGLKPAFWDAAEPYFSGNRTLDEAIAAIEDAIAMRLRE